MESLFQFFQSSKNLNCVYFVNYHLESPPSRVVKGGKGYQIPVPSLNLAQIQVPSLTLVQIPDTTSEIPNPAIPVQ